MWTHKTRSKRKQLKHTDRGESPGDKEDNEMTTFVKTLGIRGQEYIVVKDEEGYYLSINKEYLDENGCLTQELNGLQMHASKDLNDCVNSTIADVEIEHLEKEGMTLEEAIKTYYGKHNLKNAVPTV